MTQPIVEIIGVNYRWVPGYALLANDAERGKKKYSQKLTCPSVTLSPANTPLPPQVRDVSLLVAVMWCFRFMLLCRDDDSHHLGTEVYHRHGNMAP